MIDLTQPVVAIPDLRKQTALLPAMGAHSAVPGIYNEAYRSSASSINGESLSTIDTPRDIAGMLNQWFFSGLLSIRFNLKPNRVAGDDKEFGAFVRIVLGSFEPSHEHKMAFLTWVIHECCASVTYQKR